MENIGPILVVAIIIGGIVGFHYWREKIIKRGIENLEKEGLQIGQHLIQPLEGFSIENASELRQMDADQLRQLLSCASAVLKKFEDRIGKIADVQDSIEAHVDKKKGPAVIKAMDSLFGATAKEKGIRKSVQPLQDRLDKQYLLAMSTFESDTKSVKNVLNAIPERYRMSAILDMMCGYLCEGEVDSWEGCIKTFKDDVHRLQQNENFNTVINTLGRIERNTEISAFFAGITAWNTTRIATKL